MLLNEYLNVHRLQYPAFFLYPFSWVLRLVAFIKLHSKFGFLFDVFYCYPSLCWLYCSVTTQLGEVGEG